mgnify:CR=1 FL=1
MNVSLNANTPGHVADCWLPSSLDGTWLIRYLHAVHIPPEDSVIRDTLLQEIKQLADSPVTLTSADNATLRFSLLAETNNGTAPGEYLIAQDSHSITITASDWQGFLYAWFHLLRNMPGARCSLRIIKSPMMPLACINMHACLPAWALMRSPSITLTSITTKRR